jgi:hypothetical protein
MSNSKEHEYSEKQYNTLFLELTDTSGSVEIFDSIRTQAIKICQTRIHWESLPASSNYHAVYLKLDSIFQQDQLNNNLGFSGIPIFSHSKDEDFTTNPNIRIRLSKGIPKKMKYSIVDSTNTIISNTDFHFVQVWIEYEILNTKRQA